MGPSWGPQARQLDGDQGAPTLYMEGPRCPLSYNGGTRVPPPYIWRDHGAPTLYTEGPRCPHLIQGALHGGGSSPSSTQDHCIRLAGCVGAACGRVRCAIEVGASARACEGVRVWVWVCRDGFLLFHNI